MRAFITYCTPGISFSFCGRMGWWLGRWVGVGDCSLFPGLVNTSKYDTACGYVLSFFLWFCFFLWFLRVCFIVLFLRLCLAFVDCCMVLRSVFC